MNNLLWEDGKNSKGDISIYTNESNEKNQKQQYWKGFIAVNSYLRWFFATFWPEKYDLNTCMDFCGVNGPNLPDFENFKEIAGNLQHLASSQNTKWL